MLFILGACLGSFFCVFAERMPQRENFWSTRSHCPHCQRKLHFYELIPMVSYLVQKGSCRTCKAKIPFLYFSAELLFALLLETLFFLHIWSRFSLTSLIIWLTSAFILSLIDWLYFEVDTWLLYLTTFILWSVLFYEQRPFQFITALVCYLIYLIGKQWTFIGAADLFLAFSWFPWLTFTQSYLLVWSASLVGLSYYAYRRFTTSSKVILIPFIPCMTVGLILVLWLY